MTIRNLFRYPSLNKYIADKKKKPILGRCGSLMIENNHFFIYWIYLAKVFTPDIELGHVICSVQ